MALARTAVEALAPDQSALTAAAGLLKPAKWPVRARAGDIVWGECQGSGANPYRVAADMADGGAKCTCPSRKFPCKHGLALMLMCARNDADFTPAAIPDWVTEWLGRRRKTSAPAAAPEPGEPKAGNIATPQPRPEPKPADPETEAKRRAAAEKRAQETRQTVHAATEELESWIGDQLAEFPTFLADLPTRCRRIAARLVDGKAAALASRIDEMPSRLLPLLPHERIDAAIAELGQLVLLIRAWRANPTDAELKRDIIAAETRDELLADPAAQRVTASWEVLGERVATRRDGLVSVATWLMSLGENAPHFAVLQDFFPASAGRRAGAFTAGDLFAAELVFYPSGAPLRAVIAARDPNAGTRAWPAAAADPLAAHAEQKLKAPWALETPLLLPAGRICADSQGRHWWQSGATCLPLDSAPPVAILGAELTAAAGLWNGTRLSLIAAHSNWGRLSFGG
jgi:hypothetical protein